jgi:UDP-glucuronate 4-epimerase
MTQKILVTGAAGFIGFHLAQKLLLKGEQVIGLDNFTPYYDLKLKEARLKELTPYQNFQFQQLDLTDKEAINDLFAQAKFTKVVNLAAQPGVRYSLENPHAYIDSNIIGFLNILEGCRHHHIEHLVYASSSSVYGANKKIPFAIDDNVDHPISLYAATKKSNELMAYTYSHLYNIPTTGLRFFTVYGEWGRPDMAVFKFTKAIMNGEPIEVYNEGKMQRDLTYIDDIVEGIMRVMDHIPPLHQPPNDDLIIDYNPPYQIYNIGNHNPVELMELIETIENAVGKKAIKKMLPMQPGDVLRTYADVDELIKDVGFKPDTPLAVGINNFVKWYRNFYGV